MAVPDVPSAPPPDDGAASQFPPAHGIVEAGPLLINGSNRTVRLNNRELSLTSGEFDVLWLMAVRAGEPVSRDELFMSICGFEYDGLDRTIDIRVARLRKKLGDDGKHARLIKSIRSVGYLLAV